MQVDGGMPRFATDSSLQEESDLLNVSQINITFPPNNEFDSNFQPQVQGQSPYTNPHIQADANPSIQADAGLRTTTEGRHTITGLTVRTHPTDPHITYNAKPHKDACCNLF